MTINNLIVNWIINFPDERLYLENNYSFRISSNEKIIVINKKSKFKTIWKRLNKESCPKLLIIFDEFNADRFSSTINKYIAKSILAENIESDEDITRIMAYTDDILKIKGETVRDYETALCNFHITSTKVMYFCSHLGSYRANVVFNVSSVFAKQVAKSILDDTCYLGIVVNYENDKFTCYMHSRYLDCRSFAKNFYHSNLSFNYVEIFLDQIYPIIIN